MATPIYKSDPPQVSKSSKYDCLHNLTPITHAQARRKSLSRRIKQSERPLKHDVETMRLMEQELGERDYTCIGVDRA